MLKLKHLHRRSDSRKINAAMIGPIIDRLDIEKTSAPMILIIGQTGAGKSHFCNKVIGEDAEEVEESARLASCK